MRILTLDNKAFDLNELPEEVDADARFSVLDNSDPKNPDFFFQPLIFLESFNSSLGKAEVHNPAWRSEVKASHWDRHRGPQVWHLQVLPSRNEQQLGPSTSTKGVRNRVETRKLAT